MNYVQCTTLKLVRALQNDSTVNIFVYKGMCEINYSETKIPGILLRIIWTIYEFSWN